MHGGSGLPAMLEGLGLFTMPVNAPKQWTATSSPASHRGYVTYSKITCVYS